MIRSSAQSGMTLLEILVALAVFAIGGMAVMRTTGQQIHTLGTLEQKQIAGWIADNQLAMLTLQGISPTGLWLEGREVMAGQTWYWRIRRQQTTDAGIDAVTVEVSDEASYRPVLAQATTWAIQK